MNATSSCRLGVAIRSPFPEHIASPRLQAPFGARRYTANLIFTYGLNPRPSTTQPHRTFGPVPPERCGCEGSFSDYFDNVATQLTRSQTSHDHRFVARRAKRQGATTVM